MKASLYFLGMVVASLVGSAAFGHPSSLQFPGNSERVRKAKELRVIQGRVLAKDDEYPLARATLALRSTGTAPLERPRTVRTDSSGEYTFRDLEPGRYVLRAARKGYIPHANDLRWFRIPG